VVAVCGSAKTPGCPYAILRAVTTANPLNMLVTDVLAAHPAAARVFIERRMGCVGCAFAPFETVAEVARVYGIEPGDLARVLTAPACATEEERR
jgi:hybrid cluster-associated redox disulfide protein